MARAVIPGAPARLPPLSPATFDPATMSLLPTPLALLASLALGSAASAQSTIHGTLNLPGPGAAFRTFQTDTADPVGNWVTGPMITSFYYGFDYDASATDLWVMKSPSTQYGTLDIDTGAFTLVGSTNLPTVDLRSLVAHPNGTTWYALTWANGSTESRLWKTTGAFDEFVTVGPPMSGHRFWTMACALDGSLYSTSVFTDSLYQIDPDTAFVTLKGALGLDLNYMQDMDFDWSTGKLLATLSGLFGTRLAELNTVTGAATVLADISALCSQANMAVAVPRPSIIEGSCDPALPNSTGLPTKITADWSSPIATGLHLDGHYGPPLQFGAFLVGTGYSGTGVIISEGRLCLSLAAGDQIGRFTRIGTTSNSIGQFDASGEFVNMSGTADSGYGFDVPETAPIIGSPPFLFGATWHFQLWHRDGPGIANFSNAVSVTF